MTWCRRPAAAASCPRKTRCCGSRRRRRRRAHHWAPLRASLAGGRPHRHGRIPSQSRSAASSVSRAARARKYLQPAAGHGFSSAPLIASECQQPEVLSPARRRATLSVSLPSAASAGAMHSSSVGSTSSCRWIHLRLSMRWAHFRHDSQILLIPGCTSPYGLNCTSLHITASVLKLSW